MAVNPPQASESLLNTEIPSDVPEWVMLVRVGRWLGHPSGPEVITSQHLRAAHDSFQRHYKEHGTDIAIDFHHQSVLASQGRASRAEAAGWVKDTELRASDTELWGHVQPWVAEARQLIADRKYRYLSPVLLFGAPDRITGQPVAMQIHSVALTNTPFMTSLESLNEAAAVDGGGETSPGLEGASTHKGGESMEIIAALANALGKQPEEVASGLGLDVSAEEKDAAERIFSNAARVKELEAGQTNAPVVNDAVAGMLNVQPGSDETVVRAAILRLQAATSLDAVRTKLGLAHDASEEMVLNTLETALSAQRKSDAEELIDKAIEQGKIPPARRDFWINAAETDITVARQAVNDLPVLTNAPEHPNKANDGGGATLSAAEEAVCEMLDISQEAFAAAKAD